MRNPFFARTPPAEPPARPSLTLYFCLVGAFLLALLPHLPQLPFWVSLVVLVAMIVRSVGELRGWPMPGTTVTGLFALILAVAVYHQFDTVFGRDAGTALMAALLAVKFFELRGPRDVALIIFSCMFVVMSSLLYSQTIELFAYCLIMMWVLTALLLRAGMGDRADQRLQRVLHLAGLIYLQALPLTLFLFFFFPRYHGVLQIALDDATIGLTDHMEPGAISRLADDDSTAMTVKCPGLTQPDAATSYWRAIVLWNFVQGTWTAGPAGNAPPGPETRAHARTNGILQEITIYPHYHNWLFALDRPVSLAENERGPAGWSELINGDVLELTSGVLTRIERYHVESILDPEPDTLPATLRMAALQLPGDAGDPAEHIHPGVVALAAQLQKGAPTVDTYILSVLHFFRHGGFVYSDSPGPGGPDPLAWFLLRHRVGFCEDYASAFAVLMRLAHYPTRVVVGYHGAQFNPYKSLYIVKQSNAHAWDEVWIDSESRWRRVDPTSVLANFDTAGLLGNGNDPAANESISFEVAHRRFTFVSGAYLPGWMRRGMLEVQLRREEVEADWNDWVFSYDPESQSLLAQAFGFRGDARYFLAGVSAAAIAVCALALAFFLRRRARLTPVEKLYEQFCRRLARRGLPRAAWEGPLAYTGRAAEAFPDSADPIRDLGQLVARTRYSAHPPPAHSRDLRSLRREVEAGLELRT